MTCITFLRAMTIPSHGMQTLFGSPEVNGGWERNRGPEGIVVQRGIASAAELKPVTLGVATSSAQLQFGRASILLIDSFSFFFTVISMFVT